MFLSSQNLSIMQLKLSRFLFCHHLEGQMYLNKESIQIMTIKNN